MYTTRDTYNLILYFIEKAKECCKALQTINLSGERLLRAKVTGQIPKEGTVNGIYFKFHGIGCYFEYEGGAIDIDFSPHDTVVGFDLYRLQFFHGEMKEKGIFSRLHRGIIELEFSVLVAGGILERATDDMDGHLYYLRSF